MTPRVIGWALVVVQAALLVALVAIPVGSDWPTPWWIDLLAWALVAVGVTIAVLASRSLGSALTPTPEPRRGDRLRRHGWYGRVRHPIYSGVLVAVAGLTVRGGRWVTLAIGLTTIGFFHGKAAWEERRLLARYHDYGDYAAVTPRFVPRRRSP